MHIPMLGECRPSDLASRFFIWSALGTLAGFYLAGSFKSIASAILSIIGWLLAMLFSAASVDSSLRLVIKISDRPTYEVRKAFFGDPDVRAFFYAVSPCVLFTLCYLAVSVAGVSREPGDVEEATRRVVTEYIPGVSLEKQSEYLFNMFSVLLPPTLIGIRLGLGEKRSC